MPQLKHVTETCMLLKYKFKPIYWAFIASLALLLLGHPTNYIYAQETQPEGTQQSAEIEQFLQSLPVEWVDDADEYLVRGEILVGVRSEQAGQLSAAGIEQSLQMQFLDSMEFPASEGTAALLVQRWQVPVGSEWTTIAALQNNPAIEYAEPNWVVRATELLDTGTITNLNGTIPPPVVDTPYVISDSLYRNEQWYLQRINASRALSMMNDPRYDLAPKRQIIIAVLDSGLDAGSPEFSGRVGEGFNFVTWSQPSFTPGNPAPFPSCDKSINSSPVTVDDFGHGTHVAGLLGAGLNNGSGIASLGGAIVQVEPLKVLNSQGSGDIYKVSAAIKYATQCLNVNIINMSLEVSASKVDGTKLNNTFHEAVQFAHQHNVLQIAAAGNYAAIDTKSPYPAAYIEVMGVAALTYTNERASYSTPGDAVDLAAPGGVASSDPASQIYSTWSRQAKSKCNSFYLEINGGAYCYDAGTSMATPLVASVAALVWSASPGLTNDEVMNVLKNTALPLAPPPREVGSGLVDAAAALRSLIPPSLQPSPTGFLYELTSGSSAFPVGVRLDNPGSEVISWSLNASNSAPWLQINGTSTQILSGTARYGESAFFTMVISPTFLAPGFYNESLAVVGTLANGTQKTINIPVSLAIDASYKRVFLPIVSRQGTSGSTPSSIVRSFQWELPATEDDRTSYTMFDNQNVGINLPVTFTFPFGSNTYSDLRIYSDGFVAFPALQDTILNITQNYCVPNTRSPGQAIYGWWTDLNPNATGSQVSTFMAGSDRFVIEFKDVPSVNAPTYKVSFQIVLYKNGNIGLNYLTLPVYIGAPGAATVGVEARDGRFGYLIGCNAPNGPPGKHILGALPEPKQSFLIKAEDVF